MQYFYIPLYLNAALVSTRPGYCKNGTSSLLQDPQLPGRATEGSHGRQTWSHFRQKASKRSCTVRGLLQRSILLRILCFPQAIVAMFPGRIRFVACCCMRPVAAAQRGGAAKSPGKRVGATSNQKWLMAKRPRDAQRPRGRPPGTAEGPNPICFTAHRAAGAGDSSKTTPKHPKTATSAPGRAATPPWTLAVLLHPPLFECCAR